MPEPRPGDPSGLQKLGMFGGFLSVLLADVSALLLARALFATATGQNSNLEATVEPITLGMSYHLPYITGALAIGLALAFLVFGRERVRKGWNSGKGLVPPFAVNSVVLGSIYGGISGITEAAGMGALAIFLIAVFRGEATVGLVWDSLMRTLKSTGTIIRVTIGAAMLAGAYTLAGGPVYIADQFLSGLEEQPVPVSAGGAVIFDPFTPHASLPNVSNGFRWSFDLRYNVTGQPTGRSQFPEFVARSRSRPESEMREWRAWHRSWRETRAHLANSPHIPQHRWSADAPHCA